MACEQYETLTHCFSTDKTIMKKTLIFTRGTFRDFHTSTVCTNQVCKNGQKKNCVHGLCSKARFSLASNTVCTAIMNWTRFIIPVAHFLQLLQLPVQQQYVTPTHRFS